MRGSRQEPARHAQAVVEAEDQVVRATEGERREHGAGERADRLAWQLECDLDRTVLEAA